MVSYTCKPMEVKNIFITLFDSTNRKLSDFYVHITLKSNKKTILPCYLGQPKNTNYQISDKTLHNRLNGYCEHIV